METFSYLSHTSPATIESLYLQYRQHPGSVPSDWARFFEGYEFQQFERSFSPSPADATILSRSSDAATHIRLRGHLVAHTNPLLSPSAEAQQAFFDTLASTRSDTESEETLSHLLQCYTASVGVEFPADAPPSLTNFMQDQLESRACFTASQADQKRVLDHLSRAVAFEHFLHTKFVGKKRFSLEGLEAFIPGVWAIIEEAATHGVKECAIGMAHRGRLNTLVNVMQKPYSTVFAEFDEAVQDAFDRAGDVKYHMGQSCDVTLPSGDGMHLSLLFNPSHLEVVGGVVCGMCRAKSDHRYDGLSHPMLPIVVHGDAALSGQGINYELVNMGRLPGFDVGGVLHVVLNNQVGFTTDSAEGRSSRYCTDLARLTNAPVFHVNGDDPDAVVGVLKLAVRIRQTFATDVYVDIMGYRRYGHNEGDEPRFTQPTLYDWLQQHPTIYHLYRDRLCEQGVITLDEAASAYQAVESNLAQQLEAARAGGITPSEQPFKGDWAPYRLADRHELTAPIDTGVESDVLNTVAEVLTAPPASIDLLGKLKKVYDTRAKWWQEGRVDWATAESLAYGTLVHDGVPVRLAGQDAQRGTFSHRHAVVRDTQTGVPVVPLNALATSGASLQVYNTILSEYGALAFEYGYAMATPHGLTIWEAQFGDFANGAQVVIDQFIASSEVKWERYCGVVLLLPHAQEGQGPEHSSARLERFLQLAAQDNMLVCNITSPANFFHALRRQVYAPFRKPLVVMSPKSIFRHPLAVSSVNELETGSFQPVLDDTAVDKSSVTRVVICSGKLYYDLLEKREADALSHVALIRLEQLYPLPKSQLASLRKEYPSQAQWVWAQEEPANQGALSYIRGVFSGWSLQLLSRPESASPATGSMKRYEKIQLELVKDALGV